MQTTRNSFTVAICWICQNFRVVSNKLKSSERMFADNSLRVNPTKTDVTLIRCRQRRLNKDLCVNFEGATIHPSTSVKVLGMAVTVI